MHKNLNFDYHWWYGLLAKEHKTPLRWLFVCSKLQSSFIWFTVAVTRAAGFEMYCSKTKFSWRLRNLSHFDSSQRHVRKELNMQMEAYKPSFLHLSRSGLSNMSTQRQAFKIARRNVMWSNGICTVWIQKKNTVENSLLNGRENSAFDVFQFFAFCSLFSILSFKGSAATVTILISFLCVYHFSVLTEHYVHLIFQY